MKADVSVSADVRRMVAEVENQLGSVDVLINNAGFAQPRKFVRTSLKRIGTKSSPSI